jgi:tRNA(Ile)-lysidine synthase TilS/MesJ
LLLSEEQKEGLRWFLFPEEALRILRGDSNKPAPRQTKVAVAPKQYGSCSEHTPCGTDDVTPDHRKEEHTLSSVAATKVHPSTDQQREWPAQRTTATSEPTSNPEPEPEPNMELMSVGMDMHNSTTPNLPNGKSSTESLAATSTPVWKCWKPPKVILKKVYEAIKEHDMIREGDRILIGVSGGKDSLTLVQVMYYLKKNWRWLGVQFDFGCVTVDPETEAFDPSPLKVYFKALGIPYFYESQNIIQAAQSANGGVTSICSFCSRMKRGRLYSCIRREGYNVLALGQHLDDLAESFMMSAFHNGFLRTMKAAYTNDEGDIRIIRPFVNTRERDIAAFAADKELPIIPENCPACFSAPKERARMKQLLAAQEHMFPNIYNSLRSAMQPLMSITETGQEKQKGGPSSHDDGEDEMLLGCD